MRVALAGGGFLGAGLYEVIQESERHEVVAVVENGRMVQTWADRMVESIASLFNPSHSTAALARHDRVPVHPIRDMTPREIAPLQQIAPDLLLVGSFSIILKRPLLEVPRLGSVNCHPSLLPRHRGPNPYRAVLLAGESTSGVSFHQMTERIDDGPVYWQDSFLIDPNDTAGSVYRKACSLAFDGVVPLLDSIENGTAVANPQDESIATYESNLSPRELLINWTRPPLVIDRMVRACFPFTPACFEHQGRLVQVRKVKALTGSTHHAPGEIVAIDPVVTVAASGGMLQIVEAVYNGKPWPGTWHKIKVGEHLGSENG